MDLLPESKSVASPFSTGGGGPDYERYVGAYYLAVALLRAIPRGQDAGATREARFQRLYAGEPLDDLIIVSDLPVGEAKLALQIKRDLTFGEVSPVFDDVLQACWETFKSPMFTPGRDRFGIAIGLYSKTIDEHYQSVLTWARISANAGDFLSRILRERLSNAAQRSFVGLIRTKLDNYLGTSVSNDELWNFLRSMVLLHFDFHHSGSRDQAYIVEALGHILPPEKKPESPRLFAQLVQYVAEANRTAGSLDTVTLRQKLLSDGFSLLEAPDCRMDLERLHEHTRFILGDIRTDIGGLVLNRTAVVTEAREKMQTSRLLELIGPPGVGKSAILKMLVESQQGEGPAIVLAWDRLTGIGWNSFARDLQLARPVREILLAISSSAQPCIFIDGIDRVVDPGARKVINDLLRSLTEVPLSHDGSRSWTVVVSAREENLQELHTWLDWRITGKPELFHIPELTTEEVALVAEYSPRLRFLCSLRQLDPILRNPFMLSLLEDRRMLVDPETLPSIATEVEVSDVWWERLVGSGGIAGIARQQALLDLGKRAIQSPGCRLVAEGISANVLGSLLSDRILLRDPGRDVYRFSHDLLEDWVLCRVLDQHREEFPVYLRQMGQPLGLLRAVQLLGVSLLEKQNLVDPWRQLLEQVEQAPDLAPRWRQALLTAPLLSLHARSLLDKAEPLLMAESAGRLTALLIAVRTVEVDPDFSLLPVASLLNENLEELVSLLLSAPVPRWAVWFPLMGWLLPRIENSPAAVQLEAVRLMDIWQQKTLKGIMYRKEIGEIALAWLKQVEGWNEDAKATEDSLGEWDEDDEPTEEYFAPDFL